jgi:hypothetical protein
MRNRLGIGAALVLATVVGTLFFNGRSSPSYTEFQGRVYERFDPVVGAVGPISGAAISTDWDSTTAMSDDRGDFHLRVRHVADDEHVNFTVRSGDRTVCVRFEGSSILTGQLFLDGGRFGANLLKCG